MPLVVELDAANKLRLLMLQCNFVDCKELPRRLEVRQVMHSTREGNCCADLIAKLGPNLDFNNADVVVLCLSHGSWVYFIFGPRDTYLFPVEAFTMLNNNLMFAEERQRSQAHMNWSR